LEVKAVCSESRTHGLTGAEFPQGDLATLQISKIVSETLWEVKAIKVSPEEPFELASGKMSPIYIDCRIPISHPLPRNIITTCAHFLYEKEHLDADIIAGGETAGIPYAAWLADRLGKPYVYVRKEAKGYGIKTQIVGDIKPGSLVLLYEDLITDGGSKINFVTGIRQAGCNIRDCLVIFDRLQGGKERLAEHGVQLHSMTNLNFTLEVGLQRGYISKEDFDLVSDYLNGAL